MSGISSKAATTTPNKLKYNGKEEQRQEFSDGSGLEWMDFGARMYDAQIGRWSVIDPMSEKYQMVSVYNFVLNNPILLTDFMGFEPTPSAYQKAAGLLGVEINKIKAVYFAETGGNSFIKNDGRVKILWERHYFSRLTKHKFDETNSDISNPISVYRDKGAKYGSYPSQYIKFAKGIELNEEAAYASVSYGAFQIMGANFNETGNYKSAKEFGIDMLKGNEDTHLKAFVSFILSNKTLLKAIQEGDWTTFAEFYNGPAYKTGPSGPYDQIMKKHFDRLNKQDEEEDKKKRNEKNVEDTLHKQRVERGSIFLN